MGCNVTREDFFACLGYKFAPIEFGTELNFQVLLQMEIFTLMGAVQIYKLHFL